jgi:hypothetical protein
MKPIKNHKNQRNLKFFSYPKKYATTDFKNITKAKACIISRAIFHNTLNVKESPTLCFPIQNPPKFSSFLTPRHSTIPISFRNKTIYGNSSIRNNPVLKKKIVLSKLHRPVVNMKNAKISKEKLKHLNILDFGSNLKIYDEKEKKHKKKVILDRIDKQLDEIYYDYDKSNKKTIINSFSGNSADLLRNKVSFVTGIMNYLYPKIVLNKMEFLKKMKNKELKEEKVQLEYDLKGKYYNLKHKNPTENTAISKYFFIDDFENLKYGKYLTRPKVMVNNNMVSKLKYDYDFM